MNNLYLQNDLATSSQETLDRKNYRRRNRELQAKVYSGAECGSDHSPVIFMLKVKEDKTTRTKSTQKLRYESFFSEPGEEGVMEKLAKELVEVVSWIAPQRQ